MKEEEEEEKEDDDDGGNDDDARVERVGDEGGQRRRRRSRWDGDRVASQKIAVRVNVRSGLVVTWEREREVKESVKI